MTLEWTLAWLACAAACGWVGWVRGYHTAVRASDAGVERWFREAVARAEDVREQSRS
jgi:hypothetical protein